MIKKSMWYMPVYKYLRYILRYYCDTIEFEKGLS